MRVEVSVDEAGVWVSVHATPKNHNPDVLDDMVNRAIGAALALRRLDVDDTAT